MDVCWPTDDTTGEVFDDVWLRAGTTGSLDVAQLARVRRAAELFGSDTDPTTKAEMAEYYREVSALQRERHLAAGGVEEATQRARLVRGRDFLEWLELTEHLKRTGHTEAALSLLYECIDAARRGEAPDVGLHERAAIILRKLKDYEAEVRLLEECIDRQQARGETTSDMPARLGKARKLLAKSELAASLVP